MNEQRPISSPRESGLPIAALSFDATGTLFHCPRLAEIYAAVLARHGHQVSERRLSELFPIVLQELDCRVPTGRDRFAAHREGAPGYWRDVLDRLGAYLGFQPSRFAASELYDRFAHADAWTVYPEVETVLARLRGLGFRLAVASNWDERLGNLLDELDLGAFFDAVVVSGVIGVPKPHRPFFDHLIAELGVAPARLLHVGDGPLEDGEGAIAAGLEVLLLDRARGDDLTLAFTAIESRGWVAPASPASTVDLGTRK